MIELNNLEVSNVKIKIGLKGGSVTFNYQDRFVYRRIFNINKKGACYIIFKSEKLDVSYLVLRFKYKYY